MPKVDGPLFSLEASGTFDKLITYQRYKGGTRVIAKPKPTNSPSDKQLCNRFVMKRLRADWANQSPETKQYWNQQAQINGLLSGYNAFIQFWFRTIARTSNRALILPLNENSGETVYDLSSHMTTATLKNYASGADISWTDGKNHKLGPALNFPGNGTVVELGEAPHLLLQQFTYGFWIKPTSIGSVFDPIFCLDKFGYGLWLSLSNTERIFAIIGDGAQWQVLQSSTQPQPGQWYYIALTACEGVFKLYINSALESEVNATLNYSSENPTVVLGASKTSLFYTNFYNGLINHVAAYARALTAAEIVSNFNHFNSA
jgi:hypothetical protein